MCALKYNQMEQETVRISVRNLVEFILREGDIDNRTAGSPDKELMQLGSKIHRKIQRQMGSDYFAEVSLKTIVECEGFLLSVEGRADGIIKSGTVTIDEIKGTMKEISYIEAPKEVHLAQAKCYGYIYALQNSLEEIAVQMTYCQMETEEIRRFQKRYTFRELEEWFLSVVRQYEKWAGFQLEWRRERNQSAKKTVFPYEYRAGQKKAAASVYRTILRKKKLFIQAPTGVGKTMATVFPAVKAVGEELAEKIFYLTAKTITRTVAEQAFGTLKERGLQYKVVTLTAKEKICFCEETECNPEYCPYAKGHYDRVNEAVFEMITTTNDMSRENIEKHARKHMVCPFEMALDISLWVDAVICDYNYLFDPNAHLRRFFADGVKGEYLFLIDEAHNLVERAREMYSAEIYKEDIMEVRRMVRYTDIRLKKKLDVCNRQLLEMKRECETFKIHNSVGHFSISMMNLLGELERFLEECEDADVRKAVLNFYFQVRNFVNVCDRLDENYTIYTEYEANGSFRLKLFCVNPSVNLKEFLDKGNSTVFFSATLLPIMYYKQLLSGDTEDYAIYIDSPFDVENRRLFIGQDVSSRYTRRGTESYRRYADYIRAVTETRKGNYLVFFPSYRFMEEVYGALLTEEGNFTCILQEQNMDEERRENFLKAFEQERDESLLGFCVMGGVFSEGIDLTEERLIGALIVGTGLPQVCNEREILKRYFDGKNRRGFDYAYLYPGMNKVLQAAGRVIRTEADKGVILLLDERFLLRQYQETFPKEWFPYEICGLGEVRGQLKEFWEKKLYS